jgi:queuine tRNA-ribosyltransferase
MSGEAAAGLSGMRFTVEHRDSSGSARTGVLELGHGPVETPVFMPVGTNATVKAMPHELLEAMEVQILLCNAYHLYLRPGAEVLGACGGLHSFMSWRRNILTDSGGYQIFSLAANRTIEEQGAVFRSHLDGSQHRLSPEDVVDFQLLLGSDLLMPLDLCTPPGISAAEAAEALERTARWAARSLNRWRAVSEGSKGCLFGIIQGNFFPDLRRRSAELTLELGFPGYAIGGLSVGETFPVFQELLALSAGMIPESLPRYLMGVGTPEYILEAVGSGIDMVDCVFPTRTARNAQAFTRSGTLSLKNEANRLNREAIDPTCLCPTCRRYSRAYLRHLYKSREILAATLATQHNLYFLQNLMRAIRNAIREDRFARFKREFLDLYKSDLDKAEQNAEQ